VFQIYADADHAIYLNADPFPDPGFALALFPDPATFLCGPSSRKVRQTHTGLIPASADCCKAITRQAVQKAQQHCHYEASFIGELLYILRLVH
jgi:hypothetical protein